MVLLMMLVLRFDSVYRRDYGYGDCGRGSASAGGTGQSRYSLGQEMTLPTITSLLCCIANQPEIETSLFWMFNWINRSSNDETEDHLEYLTDQICYLKFI